MKTNSENIAEQIDQFFYGRYRNWKRTDEGVKIQWTPGGDDENWIPVKDWKDTPHTMGREQLMSFASFFFERGEQSKAPELFPVIVPTTEPVKPLVPYVPRRHKVGASSVGYSELSSVAKHYEIGIDRLKEILTKNHIPYGTYLKESNMRASHNLVSHDRLLDVHHAVINAL